MGQVWRKDYVNHAQATNNIANYIVDFYNTVRPHAKLGKMSPKAFERESTSKNYQSVRNCLTTAITRID
jgi:transposase InsO family protein